MTYAHVGAIQTCRNSTDTRTTSALQACSESRLFTNPSIPPHFAVRLCWSVCATEQSVYGFAMSHLVFFAFFNAESKKGLIMLSFFFFFLSLQILCLWKIRVMKEKPCFSSIQLCGVKSPTSGFLERLECWFIVIWSLSRCVTLRECGELYIKAWAP